MQINAFFSKSATHLWLNELCLIYFGTVLRLNERQKSTWHCPQDQATYTNEQSFTLINAKTKTKNTEKWEWYYIVTTSDFIIKCQTLIDKICTIPRLPLMSKSVEIVLQWLNKIMTHCACWQLGTKRQLQITITRTKSEVKS